MNTDENTIESLSPVQEAMMEQERLKAEAAQRKEFQKEKRRAQLAKVRPTGRPKGAKNKLTLLREVVLAKAENMVLSDWEDVVQTTLTMAKAGDTTCLKILWDRVIPSKRAVDTHALDQGKRDIVINIGGMEVKSVMGEKVEEVVEAEYTEVEDD
jgi:hypothetical protein